MESALLPINSYHRLLLHRPRCRSWRSAWGRSTRGCTLCWKPTRPRQRGRWATPWLLACGRRPSQRCCWRRSGGRRRNSGAPCRCSSSGRETWASWRCAGQSSRWWLFPTRNLFKKKKKKNSLHKPECFRLFSEHQILSTANEQVSASTHNSKRALVRLSHEAPQLARIL